MDQFKLKRALLYLMLFAGVFYLALELPYGSESGPQFIVQTMLSIPGLVIIALLFAGLIIWLREDVWLMIPLGLINPIPLGFLPFGFRSLEMAFVILLTYFFVVHAAMRHQGFRIGPKRLWIPLAVISLIIAFHQAQMGLGLRMAGGSSAGARRHIAMMIGVFFFVAMLSVTPKRWDTIRRLPGIYLAWTLVGNVPSIFCIYFPEIALPLGLYNFFVNMSDASNYFGASLARIGGWGTIGIALQMWLVAKLPMNRWVTAPSIFTLIIGLVIAGATALLKSTVDSLPEIGAILGGVVAAGGGLLLVCLLVLMRRHHVLFLSAFALWGCAFSGFRSNLFYWLAIVGVAALIFLQWRAVVLAFGMALLLVALALGNNRLFELPVSIERTLSFMKFGNWSVEASMSTESSSEFRDFIQDLYLSHYAADSPWLGHGYKLAAGDAVTLTEAELADWTLTYEAFIRRKDFHVGWISLYDCVGIFGSMAFFALIFATGQLVWKRGRQIGWRNLEPVQVWVIVLLSHQVVGFFAVFGAMANIIPYLGFGCSLTWLVFMEMPVRETAPSSALQPTWKPARFPAGDLRLQPSIKVA